jgi:hypothetical protein
MPWPGLTQSATGPLTKHFFFPGFAEETGGLLREAQLLARRDALAKPSQAQFRQTLRPAPGHPGRAPPLTVLLRPQPYPRLLTCWSSGERPVRTCLVPEGRALTQIDSLPVPCWPSRRANPSGRCADPPRSCPFLARKITTCCCGAAISTSCAARIPSCGRNGPRRPLLWHIYPQARQRSSSQAGGLSGTLLRGLLSTTAAAPHAAFWRAWNNGDTSWPWPAHGMPARTPWPQLKNHAETWSQQLASKEDLATQLQCVLPEAVIISVYFPWLCFHSLFPLYWILQA